MLRLIKAMSTCQPCCLRPISVGQIAHRMRQSDPIVDLTLEKPHRHAHVVKWLAACIAWLVRDVMWREACIGQPVRGAELTSANFAEMASKQPGIKHCLTDGFCSNTLSIVQNWQLIQLISEGVCMCVV
jgi:hypothetical protein